MKNIKGKVIRGKKKGRLLGFPTANIEVAEDLSADVGIYAGRVKIYGELYEAALYIRGDKIIEAFVFDFAGDLYGQEAEVIIDKKIREKLEFKDDKEAIEQITKDVSEIQDYFKKLYK